MLMAGVLLAGMAGLRATTLPPEMKAYDFAEAYYVEDGGVVISPYDHGFYCPRGVETPEGIRVMPGGRFIQFNSDTMHEEVYHFLRLGEDGTQAFFHEDIYRYSMQRNARGRWVPIRHELTGTDDFYLTQFRGMEPFDHVFPEIELHPGEQEWRVSKWQEY